MDKTDRYNEARAELKRMLPDYLRSTGRNLRANFQCPNWSNHKNGDKQASCSYDSSRNTCHCFTCVSDYDIIDLIRFDYGIKDTGEAFKKGYEMYNINPENNTQYTTHNTQPAKQQEPEGMDIKDVDFTAIAEQAHNTLKDNKEALNYLLEGRNLSQEIIDKYKLGYSPLGYNPLLKDYKQLQCKSNKAGLYRYVLPYFNEAGKVDYFQTEITDRDQIDNYNAKYRKISNLKPCPLFNERYIKQAEPVIFITEGIYDALSIEDAGCKAMALGGIGHRRVVELCREYKPDSLFIIGLDNEENKNTIRARQELKDGLTELGIRWIEPEGLYKTYKDANEYLQKDKESFIKQMQSAEKITQQEIAEQAADVREEYRQEFAANRLETLKATMQKNKSIATKSTGFNALDIALGGGIYNGLYVVGGISSIGKTSFTLQLADNLAAQGNDVLYFSLETSEMELISKSLSRYSYTAAEKAGKIDKALTTRDILKGLIDHPTRQQLFTAAALEYSEGAGQHIKIIATADAEPTGVDDITKKVDEYYNLYGEYPVIVIDYTQLLKAKDMKATDKQNVDYNILALKKMSQKMPVICISSFNRESYTAPVGLSSFKESGTIEYSSDVLIGLQFDGMDYDNDKDTNDKGRQTRVRKLIAAQEQLGREGKEQTIQIKILKQRLEPKDSITVGFIPRHNIFIDRCRDIPENTFVPAEAGEIPQFSLDI